MPTPDQIRSAIKKEILKFYPETPETIWQTCIKNAILEIPWLPYKKSDEGDTEQGVSEDIIWEGSKILTADPIRPNSFCCGAVMEAFIRAILICPDYSANVTEDKLKELVKWAFVWDKEKITGIGGGLVHLGWGEKVSIENARFGDLVQMEKYAFDGKWDDGHTQIILGKGELEGKPVFYTWSSSKAMMNIDGDNQQIHGHVVDWFWIYKERNGLTREWHIARPKEI